MPIHCVDRAYLDSNFFVTNARRVRSKGQGLTVLVLRVKDRPSLRLESGPLGSYNKFGDLVLETWRDEFMTLDTSGGGADSDNGEQGELRTRDQPFWQNNPLWGRKAGSVSLTGYGIMDKVWAYFFTYKVILPTCKSPKEQILYVTFLV